jgi:glycosyltransferase involved in cell wall biosynthesis
MASGLPIVATDVGGNPELIEYGRTGRLFKPGDPEDLVEKILSYIKSPELRILHGKAGRERAIEHFSIPSMVSAYERVYRRVAQLHGS